MAVDRPDEVLAQEGIMPTEDLHPEYASFRAAGILPRPEVVPEVYGKVWAVVLVADNAAKEVSEFECSFFFHHDQLVRTKGFEPSGQRF